MARPKNPAKVKHLSCQIPPVLIDALDAEARRLTEELRVPVNRTTALVRVLEEWTAGREKQAP
jgi:hypothetical protein